MLFMFLFFYKYKIILQIVTFIQLRTVHRNLVIILT